MRAKVTVRVKWTRVNSVFLVQLRKKMATDFRRSTRIKPRRGTHDSTTEWRDSFMDGVEEEESGKVGSRNVHRACTGNAERQWPRGSESILSSQFRRLT